MFWWFCDRVGCLTDLMMQREVIVGKRWWMLAQTSTISAYDGGSSRVFKNACCAGRDMSVAFGIATTLCWFFGGDVWRKSLISRIWSIPIVESSSPTICERGAEYPSILSTDDWISAMFDWKELVGVIRMWECIIVVATKLFDDKLYKKRWIVKEGWFIMFVDNAKTTCRCEFLDVKVV